MTGKAIWRQSRGSRVGIVMVVSILVASAILPAVTGYDPLRAAGTPLSSPSVAHWFGTDQLGRDVFTRTFAATYLDFGLAVIAVSIPLVIGTLVGAVIGITRSKTVSFISNAVIDSINAFPLLALLIGLVAILGLGAQNLIIALALTNWARYARVARTRALVIRDQDFVVATRVLGYPRRRILARHVVPNVSSETVAYALSDFVIVILIIAGLSFLGLGVRPPTPEWGAMISDGRLYLRRAWWMTVFPGLALTWTAVGVGLIVEGLARRRRGEI